MSKICPLLMMSAMTTINYEAFRSPRNQNRDGFSSAADCYEEFCQMWNTETKDCDLKHLSTTPSPQKELDQDVDLKDPTHGGITIPEKNWKEQMGRQPTIRPVDCPNPPSEPE